MMMNKIDKETLHILVDIMFQDNTDYMEYIYYSLPDVKGWPIEMEKKKITIKIENLDDNRRNHNKTLQ